jgi:hypothetical protein
MLTSLFLFAAAQPDVLNQPLPGTPPSNAFTWGLREILLIVGVGVVLGLILFLWVYLSRKDRREHEVSRTSKAVYPDEKNSAHAPSGRRKLRRKRRHHPDHFPRNPTLGETGGLPPVRSEEPSEPAQ